MVFVDPSAHQAPFSVLEDLVVVQTPAGERLYNYWVNQFVQHGMSNESLAAQFLGSDEYFRTHGDGVHNWLTNAYGAAFGRTPDSKGVDYWLSLLGGK